MTPDRLGRYRIVRKLGQGGMGVVYEARDEQLDRPVALKTLSAAARDEQGRKRLWREARAAARVRHPNVCQIFEVGEDSGELFIVMELLEGEPLEARLRRGALPLREAIPIALEMLSALDALHKAQLIHRDLKPSNVFLTPHGVKVLDFGLAKADPTQPASSEVQTESLLTAAGAIVGTPQYMAPEQIQGKFVDSRADIFAAGLILFEMLAGTKPFKGNSSIEIYHATLYENPPALGGSPAVEAADRVVRRALSKAPEARYVTALDMAEDLRKVASSEDTGEAPRAHRITRLMVLPFRMLRPDPDADFLAFSVPDAVASALSGLESLIVRSPAAALRYATEAPDFKRIAEEAEVEVVLTGTIIRAGESIRVNCQLIEAPGGTLLWSHQPQVSLSDLFQLQDQLVERIVNSLALSLTAREHRLLKHDVPASAAAYEFYLRANELSRRGLAGADQLGVARDLYLRCLEEDPRYAPGWARLGRCHRLIGKGVEKPTENFALAESAFKRSLELHPDLPLAHSLYAYLEAEAGRAQEAMVRLLGRARTGGREPELFAALVHVCRFCGLLEPSVAAHERARSLDPQIATSVNHTHIQLGDYARALRDSGPGTWGGDFIALEWMGRREEALGLLRKREQSGIAVPMRAFVRAWRAMLEGNLAESLKAAEQSLREYVDPEGDLYLGLLMARLGASDQALAALSKSLDQGFTPFHALLRNPWLDPLGSNPRFGEILRVAEARYGESVKAYRNAGGEQVLGVSPPLRPGTIRRGNS